MVSLITVHNTIAVSIILLKRVSGNDGEYQNSIAIKTYILCIPNTVDGKVFIYKFLLYFHA